MSELPKIAQARLLTLDVSAHPDADVLTAFCEQSLSTAERQPVLAHLAACADCREIVALAIPPVTEVQPALASGSLRASALAGWSWSGWMRWASVAACVVVVAAAVMIYKPAPLTQTPSGSDADVPISHQESAQASPGTAQPAIPKATDAKAVAEKDEDAAQPVPVKVDDATAAAQAGKRFESVPHAPQSVAPAPSAPLATAKAANGMLARDGTANAGAGSAGGVVQTQPPQRYAANAPSAETTGKFLPGTINLTTDGQPVNPIGRPAGATAAKIAESPARAKAAAPAVEESAANSTTVDVQAEAVPHQEIAQERADEGTASLSKALKKAMVEQWILSADGQLQRSQDAGKSWHAVPVAQGMKFTAFSALGAEVWAGGAAGLLYHSSDSGRQWTQVKAMANGTTLVSDISQLSFSDAQHGQLKTSDGQTWQTSDAGKTWLVQP